MKRIAFVCASIAACSAPEYKFAQPDGGATTMSTKDAAPPSNADAGAEDSGIADAGIDAQPADFAPIAIAATGNLQNDCAAIAIPNTTPKAIVDGPSAHCFLFFFANPYNRRWVDAKYACSQVSYAGKPARLATFPAATLAQSLNTALPQLRTWIGLVDVGDATQKSGFAWIDQSPFDYDGWQPGHPSGLPCVNWAGASQWTDADCSAAKGFLCEFEQ